MLLYSVDAKVRFSSYNSYDSYTKSIHLFFWEINHVRLMPLRGCKVLGTVGNTAGELLIGFTSPDNSCRVLS